MVNFFLCLCLLLFFQMRPAHPMDYNDFESTLGSLVTIRRAISRDPTRDAAWVDLSNHLTFEVHRFEEAVYAVDRADAILAPFFNSPNALMTIPRKHLRPKCISLILMGQHTEGSRCYVGMFLRGGLPYYDNGMIHPDGGSTTTVVPILQQQQQQIFS